MKKMLRRLFCLHLNWRQGRPLWQAPHFNDYVPVLGKGRVVPWTCTKCGKVKQFTDSNPPVQYMGDT